LHGAGPSTPRLLFLVLGEAGETMTHRAELELLTPLVLSPKTPGVYFSLLATGEVKIGSSVDIVRRHSNDSAFRNARVLAVLPGGRSVEADLHARFRPWRSRSLGYLARETYSPSAELGELIGRIRSHGFTPNDLRDQAWRGAQRILNFVSDQRSSWDTKPLRLEVTYLHFIEPGSFVPRYILERECGGCGQQRNSLEFLDHFTVEPLGREQHLYLVLQSSLGGKCSVCTPAAAFPADVGFAAGKTRIRMGRLVDRSGLEVEAYDRDWRRWISLKEIGVRRMAKSQRKSHKNDYETLRLQPSTSRHGRAQGLEERAR
jgi:hypothetical protein